MICQLPIVETYVLGHSNRGTPLSVLYSMWENEEYRSIHNLSGNGCFGKVSRTFCIDTDSNTDSEASVRMCMLLVQTVQYCTVELPPPAPLPPYPQKGPKNVNVILDLRIHASNQIKSNQQTNKQVSILLWQQLSSGLSSAYLFNKNKNKNNRRQCSFKHERPARRNQSERTTTHPKQQPSRSIWNRSNTDLSRHVGSPSSHQNGSSRGNGLETRGTIRHVSGGFRTDPHKYHYSQE